ncbi:hypothetical protein GLOTRDRAFT_117452 [Gloeophyllum trabeum ATCC 11539]|uniref:Uncharacterized protein n=1 Tax=Gloeophyllum trabeum (strain ATCC 11539 / FP-39264 / Madison 617) TaxID=670483 RepID=S7PZ27_GLOTA|nr:uncharacterized protein GLOTRDRAFT_117452 [Gloeophyllum trabeum ATCC 11539]EPQ52728.1 hypothetical protein GLOTRDRAFT_117452 [Gloeophyllum trabeum ATCC 11539]
MHLLSTLSALLASTSALAYVGNAFIAENGTCVCTSPTGCPGQCATVDSVGAVCTNYCGNNKTLACGACGESNYTSCIMNEDDTCFALNE